MQILADSTAEAAGASWWPFGSEMEELLRPGPVNDTG